MSRSQRDDDLVDLVEDLSRTLDALQSQLDEPERPRRPGGGDLLRFTEQYTIPTVISVLEATIRSLELLQGALRLAGGRVDAGRSGRGSRDLAAARESGERALDTLDDVLSDVQGAIEGRPTDPEARELVEDARALRDDIQDRLYGRGPEVDRNRDRDRGRRRERDRTRRTREDDERRRRPSGSRSRRSPGEAVRIDVADAAAGEEDEEREDSPREDVQRHEEVDVEAELDAIRREVHGDEEDGEDGEDEDDGDDPASERGDARE